MKRGNGQRHVTVVGAGIVGLCTALRLQTEGHRVTLLEPRPPGTATSFGNAGSISVTAVMPYATPGLWKRIPWMLMDEMSPLRLPWRHLHRSLPWLLRFVAAGSSRQKVERHAEAMAPLMRRTVQAHRALMSLHDVDHNLVRPAGWLSVYRNDDGVKDRALELDLMARHGMEVDVLGPEDLQQLEPGLSREFRRGVFNRNDGFAIEPVALSRALSRGVHPGRGRDACRVGPTIRVRSARSLQGGHRSRGSTTSTGW